MKDSTGRSVFRWLAWRIPGLLLAVIGVAWLVNSADPPPLLGADEGKAAEKGKTPPDLARVQPTDAFLFSVRVADLMNGSLGKEILRHVGKDLAEIVEDFGKQFGTEPAKIERLTGLIREHGLDHVPPKAAKHISGALWELRVKGRDGIVRAFYVTRSGQRLAASSDPLVQ